MQFAFLRDQETLIMPVTPARYSWGSGRNMETINITALGDVFRPGGRAGITGSFDFLLPAQRYPFMEAGAVADPALYVDTLRTWAQEARPVRMVLTGTDLNCLVYLESVRWGEKDGTRDVSLTVEVREYRDLRATAEADTAPGAARPRPGGQTGAAQGQTYTVVRGDTLSAICRRFYGHSTPRYYNALARRNGIVNPHLIFPGQKLVIPPQAELGVGA